VDAAGAVAEAEAAGAATAEMGSTRVDPVAAAVAELKCGSVDGDAE